MIDWESKRYHGVIDINSRKVEVLYENPLLEQRPDKCILICHPHPGQGGTMYNKVVATIVKAALSQKIASFRFQFSGVGQTDLYYESFDQELALFQHILKFIESVGFSEILLAGFSFGGAIVLNSFQKNLKKILVAPAWRFVTIDLLDQQEPIFLIHAVDDEIIKIEETFNFIKKSNCPKLTSCLPQKGGHFFKDSLQDLYQELIFGFSILSP